MRSPSEVISSTYNATPSIIAEAPTRILRPGLTRHFHRPRPSRSRNKNSIAPSLENRRAGSTWVSFKTRRSPRCKNIVLFDNNITDVNADAEFDLLVLRHVDILFGHAALNFGRTSHGVDHAGELSNSAVPGI